MSHEVATIQQGKREPHRWKKGQSGNPKGRPKGTHVTLVENFFRDFTEAWKQYGKPALMTMAMNEPGGFVKVAAQLMPRQVEVSATTVKLERITTDELRTLIAEYRRGPRDPLEANRDPEGVFQVGETERL